MKLLHPIWLTLAILAGCSGGGRGSGSLTDAELQELERDPVFRQAMQDSEFREMMKHPEFPMVMRNPEFRRQTRLQESAKFHPIPPASAVDQIEKQLSSTPCIAPLDGWFRRYEYALDHDRGEVNTNVVEFTLQEAGKYEFKAGRIIGKPGEGLMIDDRPYKYANGTYDLRTNRLAVSFCGPNLVE